MLKARTSRLNWPDCPRRGAAFAIPNAIRDAGYTLRQITHTHVGAAVGTAAHAGDAHLYRELAATGEAGGPERLARAVEIGIEAFREAAPEDRELRVDRVTPDRHTAERVTAQLITMYRYIIDPGDEPLLIEENRAITIGNITLSSTPDRFLVSGRLPDLKTGRYGQLGAAAQVGGQSLVVRTHFPEIERISPVIEHQPRKKPAQIEPPKIIPFDQAAAEHLAWSSLLQMDREITAWEESVAAGRPEPDVFPTRPDSFLCLRDTCPAYGTDFCHAWRLKEAA